MVAWQFPSKFKCSYFIILLFLLRFWDKLIGCILLFRMFIVSLRFLLVVFIVFRLLIGARVLTLFLVNLLISVYGTIKAIVVNISVKIGPSSP